MKTNFLNRLIFVMFLLVIASIVLTEESFAQGRYKGRCFNYSPEHHAAVMEAMNNNDYETWKTLMQKERPGSRVLEVITQENFAKFVKAHRLYQDGNIEEGDRIRAELGLGLGRGNGMGRRHQFRGNRAHCIGNGRYR